jgi:UDP-N-acetylglucosamine acyltransferase
MKDLTPYMEQFPTESTDTYIHPTALIGPNVVIEDRVYIGPYCVIGYPAEWKGREQESIGVLIKSGARLTGFVTVDSGVERITEIGTDCYLMKHSHIGHDAKLGKDVTISCGAKIGGHSEIGDTTNIGLNAVIHQKVAIPQGCMIGASSFVGKKSIMKPFYKYAGVPVRELGENIHSRK